MIMKKSLVEIKTEELLSLLIEEGMKANADFFGFGDEDYATVTITGIDYIVYVEIDENGIYDLSTLNIEKSKYYSDYDEKYKNKVVRKTIKGVMNYIKKFIED